MNDENVAAIVAAAKQEAREELAARWRALRAGPFYNLSGSHLEPRAKQVIRAVNEMFGMDREEGLAE